MLLFIFSCNESNTSSSISLNTGNYEGTYFSFEEDQNTIPEGSYTPFEFGKIELTDVANSNGKLLIENITTDIDLSKLGDSNLDKIIMLNAYPDNTDPDNSKEKYAVSASELPIGSYKLDLVFKDNQGQELQKITRSFTVIPPVEIKEEDFKVSIPNTLLPVGATSYGRIDYESVYAYAYVFPYITNLQYRASEQSEVLSLDGIEREFIEIIRQSSDALLVNSHSSNSIPPEIYTFDLIIRGFGGYIGSIEKKDLTFTIVEDPIKELINRDDFTIAKREVETEYRRSFDYGTIEYDDSKYTKPQFFIIIKDKAGTVIENPERIIDEMEEYNYNKISLKYRNSLNPG